MHSNGISVFKVASRFARFVNQINVFTNVLMKILPINTQHAYYKMVKARAIQFSEKIACMSHKKKKKKENADVDATFLVPC